MSAGGVSPSDADSGRAHKRCSSSTRLPSVPQLSLGWRYVIPPAATTLVFLLQSRVLSSGGIAPFVFFYVAVALSALLGGRAPGLLAVVLSAAVANFAFVGAPGWSTSGAELAVTALYLIASSTIALLCAAFRETAARAQQAARDLQQQTSELARSGEALQQAVSRYERQARLFDAVASTTPDFVYIFDRQGHFQYANRRLLEVWGMQLPDAIGKTPRELGYEQWHHDMHMRELAQVIETRRPIKGEVPFTAPLTGVFGIYEYIFTPVTGPDGEVELIAGTTRDVTERKRAEEELRIEEQRLRAVFENVALGIAEVDPQGRVENVNQRFCELLGYHRDELLGMGIHELTAPEDRQRSRDLNGKLDRGDLDSFHHEKRYLKKNGEPVWVHVTVSAIRNARREVVRAVGTVEDITERRRADRALRDALAEAEEGRRLLEAMMEHIPLGITIADAPDVNIRQVSRYGRELVAKRSEELTGIPAKSHPEAWQVFRADGVTPAPPDELPLTRATLKGELVQGEEWVVGRGDGARLPILCTAAPIRDKAGNITGGVIGWQDISERKRSEDALRESELRYRTVGETIPYGVWTADASGLCTYVSQSFLDMVGMTLKEVQEYGWMHLLPPEDVEPTKEHWLRCVQRGEDFEREHRFQARDGSSRYVLAIGRPIRDDGGAIKEWVGINLDVTDRRRVEEAVREANGRLLEEDRRKNEFLAVLSHELRNPLAPIRNSVYIMERSTPGGEQSTRALAVIDRQAAQLSHLVDDLLDVTRISRGKIRLQRESLRLNDLVRGTGDDFRELFRRNGIDFQVQVAGQPLRAHADRTRLAQVIGNLLQNAAKFTPSGGHVRLSVDRDDGEAVLRVGDDGAGIEPSVLGRLFEPFVQADATLDRSKGGLGLGLALARALVELHGGKISAQSDGPGTGAEFIVRIPLERTEEASAQLGSVRRQGSARRVLRVLLIEDNVDAAETLKEALSLQGHEVATAATGLDGIAKARAFRPDVVLCDIGLPGIDGFEVARRMRGDPVLRAACLIALSGYAGPEDLERSREAGFVQHVAKPPDLAALETAMLEGCGPWQRP